jgi:putative nucleotidyltransferase with HDIG domain
MINRSSAAQVYTDTPNGNGMEARGHIRTLLVDDDELIQDVFSTLLRDEGYDVYTVSSAQAALELLNSYSFDIMFVDIFLPDMSGFDLLHRARSISSEIPVILITAHADVEMARRALSEGASDFVTKPCNLSDLPIIVERNLARHALLRRHNDRHRFELQTSYESVLDALLSALNTRNTEMEGHSERVTAYTMLLADLMGVSEEDMYHIERGALLHDIGKIGVPDRILLKPGPLNLEEWEEMRKHPLIGYRMCANIDFLKGASQIILHHHERWDGSGYPERLAGEEIPLGARIFAVVDAYDSMTTDRPYRTAMPYLSARNEIIKYSGTQFDPEVVRVFLSVTPSRWREIKQTIGK